jgi:spermidine synthase
VVYLLFFLSGLSGLIYQVVWVRMFGNVFGNTIYSASIVVAVFMLGLGVGSYTVGRWADRRYLQQQADAGGSQNVLLRAYGHFELAIAALGLCIALVLPHLGSLSASVSAYVREPSGWYALSAWSYVARAAIAVGLLAPITLLMGGTLTLLIRHLVREDLTAGGWRIALLYGVNTAGAAVGAILTDFSLVPAFGLLGTQGVAVFSNGVAGIGAVVLASATRVRVKPATTTARKAKRRVDARSVRLQPNQDGPSVRQPDQEDGSVRLQPDRQSNRPVWWTAVALALTGFAALGMEILWFRHFSMLLGGFRAVFSLLLAFILAGIGLGSLAGGVLTRRVGRPAESFITVQALFVASTLAGLALANVDVINREEASAAPGSVGELWFNAWPMLLEVAIPALLMGFTFPLANAILQRAEQSVGRRAGTLYLANTAGAVAGSVAAGFALLPTLGLQMSATILMALAALAVVPLYLAEPRPWRTLIGPVVIAGAALTIWLQLPSDYITLRALGSVAAGERRLVVSNGLTELIAVTESAKGRTLVTNGHAMSATWPLSQRYMRALAHIPLLAIDRPETVLVIGFGVGNTTHAATLHPSVRRVELADLSRDILAHAAYFERGNHNVLSDPKVVVHINDGRQHLLMQPESSYDLVVLEPPPIAYAGVGALYSKEFYLLARSRLKPNGYISQWLPTYQVPSDVALAMVRAFVDVFPQSVLLSGAGSDLLLLGVNGARIEIDPAVLGTALSKAPDVRADLERVDLGAIHEIAGAFVGSAQTLSQATQGVAPVVDDRPKQEYGVRSMLSVGHGVPAAIVDLERLSEWCPRCFMDGRPVAAVAQLDEYLELLTLAYTASPSQVAAAQRLADTERRTVLGSGYLGAVVPESAEVHNVVGLALAERGDLAGAAAEFQHALMLAPDNALTHWHLGAALASQGKQVEAASHLARAVELDPANGRAHADLGLVLAVQGRLDEAIGHLERAIALDPQSEDARRNLAVVEQRLGRRR